VRVSPTGLRGRLGRAVSLLTGLPRVVLAAGLPPAGILRAMLLWVMLPFGGLWGWWIRLLDFFLPARRFWGGACGALVLVVRLRRWPFLAFLSVY
jgi:hypothetical protein